MSNKIVREPIDGQRKYVIRNQADGTSLVAAFITETEWSTRRAHKGETLVTQRALHGATLNAFQNHRLPVVGDVFATKLLEGRSGQFRSGREMNAHLVALKAEAKAGREAVKTLNALRKAIL